MTGPGASIGIPYAKGTAAGVAYKDEVSGNKLKVLQLDDATDPSMATRNARKLIEQDKVDVLMGAGSTPASIAITAVCHELKVPCITLSPVNMPGEPGSWMISIPQPPTLMVSVVVDYMKAAGVKTVGYIGYSDGWGDLVYGGLEKSADRRHQNPDQRALRARRYLSDRASAAHHGGRAGRGDDRRVGHARRAAIHCASRARLHQGNLRHAGHHQSGFRARRRPRRRRA